ncbi:helix-turn-helix transcriptional regulator [Actinomadura spongiicola]|uniref:Helix-turn-helix transcriptional regulator n=1 Tax=Actinomadura spongiicola TaxID=2303421 RepID=A0A372GFU3_9ACTN|nr:LuxR family transcriptional regulator [Actinomadura spongiicola]RFS84218.1 helix-turn-helix transcriptional regulator [Actinomadura spongiicola]
MNPLVGRARTLSALDGHVDAAARGSGGCVVVEGPFGIGRTSLLKAAALAGAERGLTVVTGRADGSGRPVPLHLLTNFLRQVTSGEADLDELARPDSNPFWLMDRIGELVEDAARRRPLLIVLDDAHRVDDVSGLALRGLVRSLASSPVLWLLARRPAPARSLAQHAVGWLIDHVAARLPLEALDDEAVAELCTGVLGAEPGPSALGWAARCGGNPWLLKTLFGAFVEAGEVVIVDGRASVVAERPPEDVRRAVGRLLDDLQPSVRRLLVSGRRIGRTFTVEEAAGLLSEPADELSSLVDEAMHVGLVRRDGMKVEFVHEVVGDALRQAPSGRPRPVPSTVSPSPPPRASGCGCDEMAARAIAAVGDLSDEAPRTLARALRLLAGAGRGAEAGRLAGAAVRPGAGPGTDAAAEARLVIELSRGLRDTGSHVLSGELLRRTLARSDVCELDRAKLKGALAETARHGGGVPGAVVTPWRGRPPLPAPSASCGTCERPLWTWLLRALTATDRFAEATAAGDAVRREAEALGEPWPRGLWHGLRAGLLVAAGRLDEARAEAEEALGRANLRAPADSLPARLALARISMRRGDLATASEQLRTAERLAPGDGVADRTALDWTLARFHAVSGRPAMAVQTLINVEAGVAPDPLLFAEAPAAAATLVRLAGQVGLDAEAARAAELARQVAGRNPAVASLEGGAEHAEGLLRRDAAALDRAVELYRLAARPLAAGAALEDAAREERGTRNKSGTARLLESAMDLYLECGAQRDVTRVQRKLRRLGVSNMRGVGADRPKSGWASLTSAELRVVRAIVDGKTNREAASVLFLSPHTVDSHLRRVFTKLNINSRVELTRHFIAHETASEAAPGAASGAASSGPTAAGRPGAPQWAASPA